MGLRSSIFGVVVIGSLVVATSSCDTSDATPNGSGDAGACEGCLANGVCTPGTKIEACGGGGVACQVCAVGTECAEGACTAPPKCNAQNCQGCCQGDTCIAPDGMSANACGVK